MKKYRCRECGAFFSEPVHVKQLGSNSDWRAGTGKRADPRYWPEHLRMQEWPE